MNTLDKLVYENSKGQLIEFSSLSPYFLLSIDGLDGLKSNIVSTKGLNQDGAYFINSSTSIRNIVIKAKLKRINYIDQKRKLLKTMPIKDMGKLWYYKNDTKKYINCIIEESPKFASTVESFNYNTFYSTLIALDPYWKDEKEKVQIALWRGDFHFPLNIPKNTGIKMGHREPSLIVNVINKGDIECGMTIEFKAHGTLNNPSLFNLNTREFIKINKQMIAGEVIKVNTEFGQKKIINYVNGIETNIMNYLDIDSTFLQLNVGDNLFRYNSDSNLDNLEINIYFNPKYSGVC